MLQRVAVPTGCTVDALDCACPARHQLAPDVASTICKGAVRELHLELLGVAGSDPERAVQMTIERQPLDDPNGRSAEVVAKPSHGTAEDRSRRSAGAAPWAAIPDAHGCRGDGW